MAVITWPDYRVASLRWTRTAQSVVFSSIFGKQALEGSAPLWEADMQGVSEDRATARQIQALIESLNGYTNQIELWNVEQPAPAGTMRGTMTLSSSAAQGATSLTIAGALSDVELVSNGTFDVDVAGWAVANTGGSGYASTFAPSSGEVILTAQGTAGGRWGIPFSCVPGRVYTATATARRVSGTGSGGILIAGTPALATQNITLAGTSASNGSTSTINATRTVTFLATQATHYIACYASTNGDVFAFDNVSVRESQAGRTLLAGDLLGLGSGLTQQVVRVTADATANGSGVITVSIGTPLRNAFSAGAAVTWDRPKALFRQKSLSDGIYFQPEGGQPWSLSLVEDYRP